MANGEDGSVMSTRHPSRFLASDRGPQAAPKPAVRGARGADPGDLFSAALHYFGLTLLPLLVVLALYALGLIG
jgi:hypothetical protein